jgi:hypothetical protein
MARGTTLAFVADQIFEEPEFAGKELDFAPGGKIEAYSVTAKTRLASAPDIPAVNESGLPGFYASIWFGLWVPKDTPRNIVTRLNVAVIDSLSDSAVRAQLVDLGSELPPPFGVPDQRQAPKAARNGPPSCCTTVTSRPSKMPISANPRRNASIFSPPGHWRNQPMVGFVCCFAITASGQAAAPPSTAMNSRRRMLI